MTTSDDDPQVPSIGDVLGPGLQTLVALRPKAADHLIVGRYANVAHGLRGHVEVARKRIAEEVLAARLPFSTDSALSDLASSEYDTPRSSTSATTSIGEVTFSRTVVHYFRDAFSVAIPTAIDEASSAALLAALFAAVPLHAAGVFDPSTGIGPHVVADAHSFASVTTANVGDPFSNFVAAANGWRSATLAHLANRASHPDADTVSIIGAPVSFETFIGLTWSDQPSDAQSSVLALLNAIASALTNHIALEARPGTVRAGTSIALTPSPSSVPPVSGGTYKVTADTPVSAGQGTASVRIAASRAGSFANTPTWFTGALVNGLQVTPSGPALGLSTPVLYDSGDTLSFSTTALAAAGGSEGQSDPELRRTAAASIQGTVGPTDTALVAGALRTIGASRTVVLPASNGGISWVYPVDPSWAQSDAWLASIEQELRTNWKGFGCRFAIGEVTNLVVRLEMTVVLRDAKDLADTTDIATDIQSTIQSYFDDRPDWYVWRAQSLRGVVAQANRKILTCATAIVRNGSGVPLSEPPQPIAGSTLIHYFFADNAVDITFTGPS